MDALVTVCSWNMGALVTVCSWNTNGIMVWALRALGTRTELWFGRGCSAHHTLLEHERNYGLGMGALFTICSWNMNGIEVWAWMLWSPYALGTRTELCSGHHGNTNGIMAWAWMLWSPYALGARTELRSGRCVLWEHERNFGLGMDALVTVCSWNMNGIMVWAWMHGRHMLLEHERNYGLGMDAVLTVCSGNTNGIMVWAWRLCSPYALGARTELTQ